jgi:hypothetical protein
MAKAVSKSKQAYYASYKTNSRWAANRKRKLERALKRCPNNLEIVQALNAISYRRKTPKTRVWTSSAIQDAKLFKSVTGRAPPQLFTKTQNVATSLVTHKNTKELLKFTVSKVSFSIGARAHDSQGRAVWG